MLVLTQIYSVSDLRLTVHSSQHMHIRTFAHTHTHTPHKHRLRAEIKHAQNIHPSKLPGFHTQTHSIMASEVVFFLGPANGDIDHSDICDISINQMKAPAQSVLRQSRNAFRLLHSAEPCHR